MVFIMFVIEFVKVFGIVSEDYFEKFEDEFMKVLEFVEFVLKYDEVFREFVEMFKDKRDFFYIGRGISVLMVFEGVFKFKEISYIYVEGLSVGELKYGLFVLFEDGVFVVVINLSGKVFDKMVSNIEEVKVRGVMIIFFFDREELSRVLDVLVKMFEVDELLSLIVYVVLF